jgi:ornithine--oxo-acid transaminase
VITFPAAPLDQNSDARNGRDESVTVARSPIVDSFFENGSVTYDLASEFLNSKWVNVLRVLGMDKVYHRAEGAYLYDDRGERYLDFHTGEGVASLGHNHPRIKAALIDCLLNNLPDGIQTHYGALSGLLARELVRDLPETLCKVEFTNSGAETVDTAMKFARSATRRPRFVSCAESFHGLSFGPLSLIGEDEFQEGFGPLLPGCCRVPFGDLERLEQELRKNDVAAFISEPIQGRTVKLPNADYFREAQRLCRKHGTLFIMDEIQTGLGRTGRMYALEEWGLEPDMVLVAKALSGGYMPVGAVITTRKVYDALFDSMDRSYVHHSTYARNRLSMAAGLATLQVIREDRLVERARVLGERIQVGLERLRQKYELVHAVRVRGLMIGLELGPPTSVRGRMNWNMVKAVSKALCAQTIVIPLLKEHRIVSLVSGRNYVIKFLPPLVISDEDVDHFLASLDAVLAEASSSVSKSWGVVMSIARATVTESISWRRRRASRAAP